MQSTDCFTHQQIVQLMNVFGHKLINNIGLSTADLSQKGIHSPS